MLGLEEYEKRLTIEELENYKKEASRLWSDLSSDLIGYKTLESMLAYVGGNSEYYKEFSGTLEERLITIKEELSDEGYSNEIEEYNKGIYKEEYKSYAKSLGRWEEQVRLVEVGKKLEEGLYEYVVIKGHIENSIYISPYKVMNMTSGRIYYSRKSEDYGYIEDSSNDIYSKKAEEIGKKLKRYRTIEVRDYSELSEKDQERLTRLGNLSNQEQSRLATMGISYERTGKGYVYRYDQSELEVMSNQIIENRGGRCELIMEPRSGEPIIKALDRGIGLINRGKRERNSKREIILLMVRQAFNLKKRLDK